MKTMKKWLLPGILVLAILLRVVGLEHFPTGFTPDEASFGYDAYSILKTGKDQWGKTLPLVFESFGDYKSPLYGYLTIPFVALLGLTEVAVRLPNALLGSFAILVVYFLVKELFKKQEAALLASFFLAISPWHIMMSRGAFEANLTTFFLPLGIYLFLKKRYALSGLIFGLNLFSYHSAKFVTPLIVALLVVLYWSEIKKNINKISVGAGIFLVILILTGYTMFDGAGARVAERSITQGATEAAFAERTNLAKTLPDSIARLIHNKYTVSGQRFLYNYVTYLSPQFFFTQGPREGTYGMVPGMGTLYLFTIVLFIAFRQSFYKGESEDKKGLVLIMAWLLIAPIPASLATGVGYSANRAVIMLPALEIIFGLAGMYLINKLKHKKAYLFLVGLVVLISFGMFLETYFIQSKYKIAKDMLYGNMTAAKWVVKSTTGEVIVSRSLSEPHIYLAFAEKTDPHIYQEATKTWKYKDLGVNWVDQMSEYRLGRYKFVRVKDAKYEGTVIGRSDEFLDATPDQVITYPDQTPAVYIFNKSEVYAQSN